MKLGCCQSTGTKSDGDSGMRIEMRQQNRQNNCYEEELEDFFPPS